VPACGPQPLRALTDRPRAGVGFAAEALGSPSPQRGPAPVPGGPRAEVGEPASNSVVVFHNRAFIRSRPEFEV
jgi:hypothetical protein